MAEVNIYCPHCNRELSVDDSYMGLNLVCPLCNGEFLFAEEDDEIYEDDEYGIDINPNIIDKYRSKISKRFKYFGKNSFIQWIFAINKLMDIFEAVQKYDRAYIEEMDLLEKFGKKASQLAAVPYTIFFTICRSRR